jgi:hypothetical protein
MLEEFKNGRHGSARRTWRCRMCRRRAAL